MSDSSENVPYPPKPDPRKDTDAPFHCPACGELPCACGAVVDDALDREDARFTGPRITCEDIDMAIALAKRVDYHRFPHTTVTVCCVTLSNGYCVVGKSATVSPENFDIDIGRRVAMEDVQNQLWELLGFRLKQALYEGADKV